MPHTKNPWTTLRSRIVYQNPWIRVREDDVIRPDGTEGIYGVVETKVATGVVALTEANEVYLVGQYRYTTKNYSWELIEGGAGEGEDPLAAAQRELREEAGLIASEWQSLGEEIHTSNCLTAEVAKIYIARGLTQTAPDPDPTEVLQVKKVPFAEALRMVDDGEIKDAVSIIGIFRAARLLNQR